jgi:hypothetical protein
LRGRSVSEFVVSAAEEAVKRTIEEDAAELDAYLQTRASQDVKR